MKAPRHWTSRGVFTGDYWIPCTKGQLRGKCIHLMTSSYGLHLQARLSVTEQHRYQCAPNPIEKAKLITEFEIDWKLFAKKQHRYQIINNIVMDMLSLFSRKHAKRGPTHRPSSTHMARKNPSGLYPSAQEYVRRVPRGNTFWADVNCNVVFSLAGRIHKMTPEFYPRLYQLFYQYHGNLTIYPLQWVNPWPVWVNTSKYT